VSLRADVEASRSHKPPCLYQRVRAALSDEDRAELDEMMADATNYSERAISAGLLKAGHVIGATTLHNHRAGVCPQCR
jgi:hypothetical protein